GHQSLPDASLQLDQAASIQRRVTTCGGRRKTQPTVRDGLTTTVDLLEVNFTEIENRLFSLYEEHVLVGEVGRIVAFSDMVSWVLYEEVLEEIGVLVMLDETRSVYSNFDFGEFVSREFMMEQADLGLYRKEYVDKLISNY
ncbi:hypothetical protein, partial [Pseudomonas aeruginosa]|uniref:hypothetical protein n=1 Tax=Pseudomonas aeruginosa TaxID=287 RepID=UPI001482A979